MIEIQEFLAGIGNAITTFFDFCISYLQDFMDLLVLLSEVPQFVGTIISWFPNSLLTLCGLFMTVVILYKILGREG